MNSFPRRPLRHGGGKRRAAITALFCRLSPAVGRRPRLCRMYAGAVPHAKKPGAWRSRRGWLCSFDAKTVRQSPITVRLGTDSVNPFRRQIYKSFVIVALKPQTAKPPAHVSTCDGPVLPCAHYACTCAFSGGRARNRMLRVVRAFLSRGVRAGPSTRQMPGQ